MTSPADPSDVRLDGEVALVTGGTAVAFLASHRGRWITGQVLDASGGLVVRPRL